MAQIVKFPALPPPRTGGDRGPAEIVIFPGVRYERAGRTPARRKRKRKAS